MRAFRVTALAMLSLTTHGVRAQDSADPFLQSTGYKEVTTFPYYQNSGGGTAAVLMYSAETDNAKDKLQALSPSDTPSFNLNGSQTPIVGFYSVNGRGTEVSGAGFGLEGVVSSAARGVVESGMGTTVIVYTLFTQNKALTMHCDPVALVQPGVPDQHQKDVVCRSFSILDMPSVR